MRGVDKDTQALIRKAHKARWRVERTRAGHPMLYPPDGGTPIVAAGSSGDQRAVRNLRSQLRRAGLTAA